MPVYFILLAATAAAAYTDRRRKEIPLWIFPSAITASALYLYIFGQGFGVENVIALCCTAVPVGLLCFTGKSGGGDLIMFAAFGLLLGYETIPFMMIFWFVLMMHCLRTVGHNETTYPMAPFAFMSMVIFLIWRCINVFYN